jgi:hypothetical protein
MGQKRHIPRCRRRLAVRLGEASTFTADLSPGGFCVELPRALRLGGSVSGTLSVGEERFDFTGTVAWARAAEPRLQVRARMGIQFTGIANAYYARCAELLAPPAVS